MDEAESAGGPLICVESRLSHQWRGIDGLSIKPDASMVEISTDEAQSKSVSFEITPRRCQVTTHEVKPTPTAELLLHRFYPIT
jgi:hypothetical protein